MCPLPEIFYDHYCESPVMSTHQLGRFYHMNFQNCHIVAIGDKNRKVCQHQSVAKIGDQVRRDRRINSPGALPALGIGYGLSKLNLN